MPIRVKIANTPLELDRLFQTRHKIFVEEEGYFKKSPNGRIFDQFDAFPNTVNIVAMVNKQVVGGLRLTEWSQGGSPSDDFFDFSPYLPDRSEKVVTASMLCLQRDFRKIKRLCFLVFCMGAYWAFSRENTHFVATINPLIEPLVRSIGFKPVKPPFHCDKHGVDVLPVLLDRSQINSNFLQMANFQGFHGSLRAFDRELYKAGEKIIARGEEGNSAYVIVNGQVAISKPGSRADDPPELIIAKLGPCEIFGEVSLLTNQPRTADVVALTEVDLVVIERAVFWEQLHGNPDLQIKLLQLLGNRLVDAANLMMLKNP